MNTVTVPTRQPRSQSGSRAGKTFAARLVSEPTTQLALLVADPVRRTTAADAGEIRRAVEIGARARTPRETAAALIRELAEEFGVPVLAVMEIVRRGGRP